MIRMWAFWRRLQYGVGLTLFCALTIALVYFTYWYVPPTCFDEKQNGIESGVDCGGSCTRICAFNVIAPKELWVRAFKIRDGQYNAIAYVENRNKNAGTVEIAYTIGLYDREGLITERKGKTSLPPDGVYPIFEGRINAGGRVPTQSVIKLEGDPIWVPATAGREQFKVERRELRGADTKPELVASLTNTSIYEAKDVEIVATIFDAKNVALTSSRTFIEYFGGRTTREVVFTWPEPIAKTLRTCEVPTDVILGIDLSGSMNDDGGTPPEPISSVVSSAASFANRLKENDQVGVVAYSTEASLPEPLTKDRARIAEAIKGTTIAPAEERGSTNTGDAIKLAQKEFATARHNPNARKVFVLLSDGLANAPGETPEQYALDASVALKKDDVEVYTIGLGTKVNDAFLENIASDPTKYLKAASRDTIDSIYRTITSSLCEDGAAVIEIIPKTTASFAPLR